MKTETESETETDSELVGRFNAGDEEVFVEIMRRYNSRIFAVAMALLHNHADAEEIVQETFIRAHRGLKNFRGDASLSTWLHRVAHNLSCNRYWFFRRRMRHLTQSLECPLGADTDATLADLVASEEPGQRKELELAELTADLESGVEKLTPKQREILTMRNTLHYSYGEIAAAIGIEVGTVKSRIARARECLREQLDCAHSGITSGTGTA